MLAKVCLPADWAASCMSDAGPKRQFVGALSTDRFRCKLTAIRSLSITSQ